MKLKLTIESIYHANAQDFDTKDPEKIAKLEERLFIEDGGSLFQFLTDNGFKLKVKVIK